MPVQVACSHCAAVYTVPDNLGRKSVKCRKCQQMFVINDEPAAAPAPTPPAPTPTPEVAAASAWDAIADGPRTAKEKPKTDPRKAVQAAGAGAARAGVKAAQVGAQAAKSTAAISAKGFRALRSRFGEEGKPPVRTALALSGVGAAGLVFAAVTAFWLFGSKGNAPQAVADASTGKATSPEPTQAAQQAKAAPTDEPAPVPAGARDLTRDVLERVKKATVYLRVTSASGHKASGSGFFGTGNTDVVLTNAHVLGMLAPDSRQPDRVEVVLNSGESGEVTFNGKVLGVDREADLGVVKLLPRPGSFSLPKSLDVRSARNLFETQAVFVFGYPLGENLGKEVTVSPSQVSSLRKEKESGQIKQIQVNGGMQPGNSGGPVVDAGGNVIGVAVSVITGTQLNFAVPGDKVRQLLNGRVGDLRIDQPFLKDGKITVPVSLEKIDPLKKISSLAVEVWSGNVGAARSSVKPEVQFGDTPHERVALQASADAPSADVPLPPLASGKVTWLQPTWVNGAGETRWGEAVMYQLTSPPVERKPVDLVLRPQVGSRSVQLTAKTSMSPQSRQAEPATQVVNAQLQETVRAVDPQGGAEVDWGYSSLKFTRNDEVEDELLVFCQQIRALGARYKLNRLGKLGNHQIDPSRVPMNARDGVKFLHGQVQQTLEALALPLPENKTVAPGATWRATQVVPVSLGLEEDVGAVDFQYTYLGARDRNGRAEAVVGIDGKVHGVAGQEGQMGGHARGTAVVDVATGQVVGIEIKLTLDKDVNFLGRMTSEQGTHELKLVRTLAAAAP